MLNNLHQPRDHLSLVLVDQSPSIASITTINEKLHIITIPVITHQRPPRNQEHPWVIFPFAVFLEHGGGGWVDGSSSHEAEEQFEAWIILKTENEKS